MTLWRTTLVRFAAAGLIVGLCTQTAFAIFRFSVSGGDSFAIDYEGSGTIQHMNASQPTRFTNPPTSLLDLNIMRASDFRLQMSGISFGTLNIGQPAPGPDLTFVSYTLSNFSPGSFVLVSQLPSGAVVLALNPAATETLQALIDLHGSDNLFLSMSLFAGIFNGGTVTVFSAVREISIDIKPGNEENSINPNGRGKIAVAILTTTDFDANTVDIDSLRFGATGSEASAEHAAFDDLDGDGDLDLVLHFRTRETNIACGTDVALLRGTSLTGELIGRWDTVSLVGCH